MSGCDSDTNNDDNDLDIDRSQPVILFSYLFETKDKPESNIMILNAGNTFYPFDDNVNRSYPSLSPDKSKMVYLYDFALFPMVGVIGDPSIRYYDFDTGSDIEILPYFYGESKLVQDEGAVYEVDFNDMIIKKITDLGEDHFIMSINSFD